MRLHFLLVPLLVACSESEGLPPENYPDVLIDARCAFLVRCGLFTDVPACVRFQEYFRVDDPNVSAAVEAGHVVYDEAAAAACVTAFKTGACDAMVSEACSDVFRGQMANGAACAIDAECISGRCNVSSCMEACCAGSCVEAYVPAIGQQCAGICEDGAYCGAFDMLCHAQVPAGEPCNDPAACGVGYECAGYYQPSGGVCTALPKLGESCETRCSPAGVVCATGGMCAPAGLTGDQCMRDEDCSEFYRCNVATSTCAEQIFPARAPDGSRCANDSDCASRHCSNDFVCGRIPICI